MNTTTPIDDNGDDSFDWREDWEPMTPEELEQAFPDIHAEQNGEFVDPYLYGESHQDPNQMYDE